MEKTYQFKKVCKDDSHELAELKQQKINKADVTFAAHCHNVNVLLSNISLFRSTSESRPNSIERKNVRPYVRPYVRPSTKSFFNLNEIWYIGRGR